MTDDRPAHDDRHRGAPGDLDLDRPGVTRWCLALPYRWEGRTGHLDYPLTVARRGAGPCVLLVGGTHGDEFEGQVAATRLADRIRAADVRGTLIVLPAHNRPACLAGLRRSPIDGADLNRVYPGRTGDGPSHAIARFVTDRLLAAADVVIDIHSGGATHEFVPSSNLQGRLGSAACTRDLPALLAFDAPYAIVFDAVPGDSMPHAGTLEAAAIALGKRAFSSEIGGGGRITPASLAVAETGIVNLLRHLGAMVGEAPSAVNSRSRLLALDRPEHYVSTPVKGHLVPFVSLGDAVEAGRVLGEVHRSGRTAGPPVPLRAATAGIVVAVPSTGIVDPGAPVFVLAEPVAR